MSMNAVDKNSLPLFTSDKALGLTITFISLGLIISNFDSLMISAPMWILYPFYGLMDYLVP
jgi:hypothetical protein